jgi:nuclear pore complex protein Nup133
MVFIFTLTFKHHSEGTILSEAIRGFMDEAKDFEHEDLIRAFFRLRVAELGQLLPYVTLLIRQAAEEAPESLLNYLGEANVIALVCITSMSHIYMLSPNDMM